MTDRPASGPLSGVTIVVTRTRAQASSLVDRLAGKGASVVELPVIGIEDPLDGGEALHHAAAEAAAGAYDWLVFTSTNAASRFLASLDDRPVPPATRWAAIGAGTAGALARAGHPPELVPATSVAEALAEALPVAPTPDGGGATGRILFPRAESVRGALVPGLRARGWTVDEVVAYRTVAGSPGPDAMAAASRADAVAFTSSSTVERTIELLGIEQVPPVVASIGPITSASAVAAGLAVTVEAVEHTIDGLVAALVSALEPGANPAG
ncbi:MAG TPA: uroporphyrinogen-III synthase [Acidimicrobiales bacterium]|nr:uroporphyrinogen-III synthase [Acidimicrobiales bacterium]